MDKIYLKNLETKDAEDITHIDINNLGSHMSVRYGDNSYYKTREEAIQRVMDVVKQPQNIRYGITSLILNEDGDVIHRIYLRLIEE